MGQNSTLIKRIDTEVNNNFGPHFAKLSDEFVAQLGEEEQMKRIKIFLAAAAKIPKEEIKEAFGLRTLIEVDFRRKQGEIIKDSDNQLFALTSLVAKKLGIDIDPPEILGEPTPP